MKCPVCTNELSARTVAGVTLDTCDGGCAGIWFDQFEFKKFDEKKEPDAETLLHLKINPAVQRTASMQLSCPKCLSFKMIRHFSSVKRKVTVDDCPNCAGVWLDAGELTEIRNEFETEYDRKKAAETLFTEMFEGDMKLEHQQSLASAGKARAFANALRFICPSFYVPGKQKSGAF
jgi:Zn-finger nucleic acid-binding protein